MKVIFCFYALGESGGREFFKRLGGSYDYSSWTVSNYLVQFMHTEYNALEKNYPWYPGRQVKRRLLVMALSSSSLTDSFLYTFYTEVGTQDGEQAIMELKEIHMTD